jgi:glutamine amidotransferase
MSLDVAIIDYKMSNVFSVYSACSNAGLKVKITSDAYEILDAKMAILPGVGSFSSAMRNIAQLKLDRCIYDFINSNKPFLGICLGLQLLFSKSYEFEECSGLDIIKGTVKKFIFPDRMRVPMTHTNWNYLKKVNSWKASPLEKINDKSYMYFVHSFFVTPNDKSIILCETKYGDKNFCSAIKNNNIFACQFHPEKSSINGLKIYNYFKEKIST